MKNALKVSALAIALALSAPAEATTATVTVPLSQSQYTDLGTGPIVLGARVGEVIYQVSDTQPAAYSGGQAQLPDQPPTAIRTTSHVWAIGSRPGVAASVAGGLVTARITTNIPMILAAGATVGANGAVSGITPALLSAYASGGEYLYLPQGAAVGGAACAPVGASCNPAGWFYFTAATATSGTLYNNQYVYGRPAIPATPTPFVSAGPGAYTTVNLTIGVYAFNMAAEQGGGVVFSSSPSDPNNETIQLTDTSSLFVGLYIDPPM